MPLTKSDRLAFILRNGVLRFGLPISVCVGLALYSRVFKLTLRSLFTLSFLTYFGVAFVFVGLIGGYWWGAHLWRQDHAERGSSSDRG